MNEKKLRNRLIMMIVTVFLLVLGLTITSVALVDSVVSIQRNRFVMSEGAALKVNNGQPVVNMTDIVYEPGGRYVSEFPITNMSTFDVWYRVYFTDVEGELKDDITVTIREKNGKTLCEGLMYELDKNKVSVGSLGAGEEKILEIEFYFLPYADNSAQGQNVSFNITTNATQKQNNTQMDFGD